MLDELAILTARDDAKANAADINDMKSYVEEMA
jgi:hypothetical protein